MLERPINKVNEGNKEALLSIFACLDLTSLEATDTFTRITDLCAKVKGLPQETGKMAAVCFYPVFTAVSRKALEGTGVKTAVVAGAFPHGQSPLQSKMAEINDALGEGAEEIDTVINRGELLEGNYFAVFDEIAAMKEACGQVKLKVILETGELQSEENIALASRIALEAGADFIKTSTGKISVGATLEAAKAMLVEIKEFYDKTGQKRGIKYSGGISDVTKAMDFIRLTEEILGSEWIHPDFLRIGTSRLANDILNNYASLMKNERLINYF